MRRVTNWTTTDQDGVRALAVIDLAGNGQSEAGSAKITVKWPMNAWLEGSSAIAKQGA